MKFNVREKRHRLPRETYRGQVTVPVTACIEGKSTPFADEGIVKQFLEFLHSAMVKHNCIAFIYCFMPDHLHLVLHGQDANADVWRAMVSFKQQSGYWFRRHRPEFAWQKDFYDHIIRADEDLGAQIRYVADNPVRKGIVKLWSEYPFTGAIGIDIKTVMQDASTMSPHALACAFHL